jgi:hypothetical protein
MAVNRVSVDGPDWIVLVRQTEEKIRKLEANNWNFSAVPEVFARPDAAADVVAKELVHIHDGKTMTRVGRLIMGGVGHHFNLMGPIRSDAQLKVTDGRVLSQVNKQMRSFALKDLKEYKKIVPAKTTVQPIEYYNYGIFYTLRDLVFWLLIHDAGCYPSTLEHMVRKFAEGYVIQNDMYAPARPSRANRPVLMAGACLMMQFPSKVVEWMDKPLFGGLARETVHTETLLTLKPSRVSHPYLPLVAEGKVKLGSQAYYAKRFAGASPKDAVRGPNIPAESAS